MTWGGAPEPFDGTAVVLHLIEAARACTTVWREQGTRLKPEATALVAWVAELEERYAREQPAPAPAGWEPRKWRELLPGDRVSMGGQEATIAQPAVTQHWHVDPRSNTYRPQPMEHAVTLIRLEGREQAYRMPPDGEVETLRGEAGREADALAGYRSWGAEQPVDVLAEWAWEAVQTLRAAGLDPR